MRIDGSVGFLACWIVLGEGVLLLMGEGFKRSKSAGFVSPFAGER